MFLPIASCQLQSLTGRGYHSQVKGGFLRQNEYSVHIHVGLDASSVLRNKFVNPNIEFIGVRDLMAHISQELLFHISQVLYPFFRFVQCIDHFLLMPSLVSDIPECNE